MNGKRRTRPSHWRNLRGLPALALVAACLLFPFSFLHPILDHSAVPEQCCGSDHTAGDGPAIFCDAFDLQHDGACALCASAQRLCLVGDLNVVPLPILTCDDAPPDAAAIVVLPLRFGAAGPRAPPRNS